MPVNTHYIDGDNYQLRQVIFASTPKAVQQCVAIAKKFKGKSDVDTCRNIFNFLKNEITYVADGSHQKVKLPSALLREKVGDCKSYSLFTAAILQNLGIPWKYVLVSYREDPTPTHIYVVTESGIIIDAVWGKFNSEKEPTHKYYYNDMRISTITGFGKSNSTEQKSTGNFQSITENNVQSQGIGAPRAFIWFRDMKGRKPNAGEQIEWGTKKALNSIGLGIVLQVLKENGGGLSSMLYNLVFNNKPTYYTIPESQKVELQARIENFKKSLGFKPVTSTDMDKIMNLYAQMIQKKQSSGGQTLVTPTGSDAVSNLFAQQISKAQKFQLQQTMLTDLEKTSGYDAVMGKGQWEIAKKVSAYTNQEANKLAAKYSVIPSQEARKKYGEFENKWFWMGGDPWDLNDAIQEGAKKSPRGKLFNYVLGKAFTRGLTWRDSPLLVRSIIDIITGDKFSLDASGSFVLGKGLAGFDLAVIYANTKLITGIITSLLGLFLAFSNAFGWGDDEKEGKDGELTAEDRKKEWYLSNGYMLKQDAQQFNAPVPYLDEQTVSGETFVKPDPKWFAKQFGGGEQLAGFGGLILPLLIGGGAILALNSSKKIASPRRRKK